MKIINTEIKDVLIIEPKIYGDSRGFFFESWNQKTFNDLVGKNIKFVQDNHSKSSKGVLRGLHYQKPRSQGKLVRVASGAVMDVVVDLRKDSPTFGKYINKILSSENGLQLWVPEGMAHGFLVLTETADFLYKTTDYWVPENELSIKWNDEDLLIDWNFEDIKPIVSEKDGNATRFKDAEYFS